MAQADRERYLVKLKDCMLDGEVAMHVGALADDRCKKVSEERLLLLAKHSESQIRLSVSQQLPFIAQYSPKLASRISVRLLEDADQVILESLAENLHEVAIHNKDSIRSVAQAIIIKGEQRTICALVEHMPELLDVDPVSAGFLLARLSEHEDDVVRYSVAIQIAEIAARDAALAVSVSKSLARKGPTQAILYMLAHQLPELVQANPEDAVFVTEVIATEGDANAMTALVEELEGASDELAGMDLSGVTGAFDGRADFAEKETYAYLKDRLYVAVGNDLPGNQPAFST